MATDSSERVIQIPRSDKSKQHVILNVRTNGKGDLDVRLLATEGESPYIGESMWLSRTALKPGLTTDQSSKVKHDHVSELQDRKSQLPLSEWQNILQRTLLRRFELTTAPEAGSAERVEILASINGSKLTVGFRKNISGIIQRLGEITLVENQDIELDTLSWTSVAIQRSSALEQQILDLTAKYESATKVISKLNGQIDDLVAAKRAHEDAMLVKFRDILNSKKLKIRDQQRLLATANLDPIRVQEIQAARASTSKRSKTAEPSRAGKRKAGDQNANLSGQGNSSDATSDDFEPMVKGDKNYISNEEQSTLEASGGEDSDDDATADEDTAEEEETGNKQVRRGRQSGQAAATTTTSTAADRDGDVEMESPPPARELPFQKRTQSGAVPAAAGGSGGVSDKGTGREQQQQQKGEKTNDGEGDDEETTDDEL